MFGLHKLRHHDGTASHEILQSEVANEFNNTN
jgi:hypothetical protein